MRKIGIAAVLVALLALPGFGVINVKLIADNTSLEVGQQTTVRIMAMATSGLYAIAGSVRASPASDPGTLQSAMGSFAWAPEFQGAPPIILPHNGTPGNNGGWDNFGSTQGPMPDQNIGLNTYFQVASYRVLGMDPGTVTLSFLSAPVGPIILREMNGGQTVGIMQPVTIQVTPEPATLALLALGSLLALRRRG